MSIDQAIPTARISNYGLFFILYFPIGLLLAIFRIFLTLNFLCSQVVLSLMSEKSNHVRRIYEKIFISILGVVVVQKNREIRDHKSLLVSNSLTRVDGFFISILCNCLKIVKEKFNRLAEVVFHLHSINSDPPQDSSIIVYPESHPTAGLSLLKFNNLPSSLTELQIQPVAVKLVRPLPVMGSTIDSSLWSDLFWMYFSIFNIYEVKFCPVLHKNEEESSQQFADRIQKKIAEELTVECTCYDNSDVEEFIKRKKFEARKPQEHLNMSATSSPMLRELVQQVKDILPHVPSAVILKDIQKTRSVDVTVTNLLEGVVQFTPEAPQQPSSHQSSPPRKKLIKVFPAKKKVVNDHSNFQERKEAFLLEARENYLRKRGLLQQ